MLLKWFGQGEPFSVVLLIYCAASITKTTPFGLTRSFVLIFSSGSSFYGVGFWLYPGMSAFTDLKVTSEVAGAIGFGAY